MAATVSSISLPPKELRLLGRLNWKAVNTFLEKFAKMELYFDNTNLAIGCSFENNIVIRALVHHVDRV